MTHTKDEALELTQIDFGGDCDTPPKPWPAIWVAWNSEDGFTFWDNEKMATKWSAADSNEWPVQFSMQKTQPTVPLTDKQLLEILVGIDPETKRLPSGFKDFARAIEARHGITKGQE